MPWEKKSISEPHLVSVIRAELSKGNTIKTNCYELLRTKYKLTKQTFLRKFDQVHSEWAKLKDIGEVDGIVAKNNEAAKRGLYSKMEKALNLQKEIDTIDQQLNGEIQFTFLIGNNIVKSHIKGVFKLPVQIQNELRDRKLKIIAELNKMEGDYQPFKVAETNVSGQDIERPKPYPREQLLLILQDANGVTSN